MKERLLQFIWQEKYFHVGDLQAVTGERLIILDSGTWNQDQGPDFLHARIMLDGTIWAGNIELHVKSSHWFQHRHETDPAYNNVILHVVWENDHPSLSLTLPTLVLQDRVSVLLLERYNQLMQVDGQLVCQEWLPDIPQHTWAEWKRHLQRERLERKTTDLWNLHSQSKGNWEDTCWWWMARYMGGIVNGAFFEAVAQSLPTRLLARHREQVIQLEALLLGQANLLDISSADPYVQLLQREYRFLRHKYQLPAVHGQALKLRMRPASFPEIRLAQLAMLLHRQAQFSRYWLEYEHPKHLASLLDITANDFWHYHYTLAEASPYQPKHMGNDLVQQLLINVIVPYIYAAGQQLKQAALKQKAINWLDALPPEKNTLIKQWERVGIHSSNAGETQALIELKKYYCQARKCLDCAIGRTLLNKTDGF